MASQGGLKPTVGASVAAVQWVAKPSDPRCRDGIKVKTKREKMKPMREEAGTRFPVSPHRKPPSRVRLKAGNMAGGTRVLNVGAEA